MPSREGAIHVHVTRRHYKGKTYENVLLRRSYREGGKVKKETLGNITHLPAPVIDLIRGALAGEVYLPASDAFEIVRSRPHGHVAAVVGTLRKIGLEQALASRTSKQRDLVVAMIVARVLDPASKLATARSLAAETASSSLGHVLDLEGEVSEEELYRAMDWLRARQARIEKKLAAKHLPAGAPGTPPALYDVTSSYYTGAHCTLAAFGHSRDRKKGYPQIVYGLLCNKAGCPVAVDVFEGNTGDPTTLAPQLEKLSGRFGLERLVVVGDRGLLNGERIEKELRPMRFDWLTSLKAPAVQKLAKQGRVPLSLFDEQDLAEITSPDYPGERLVLCRNPLLAAERARKRTELLAATEAQLEKIAQATRRARRPLRGEAEIGLRVGRVIDRYKAAKHFVLEITEESFAYRRNEEQIAREAVLDGLYVLRTSVEKKDYSSEEVVRAYKSLSKVEQAFRSLKSLLKVRPIYHRLEKRVRAHVFLCMLAYYVEWHMRQALQPVLFGEDDPEAAEDARASIVGPAQRSASAKQKTASKRTEGGHPVHSFETLLKDLSTLCLNSIEAKGTGAQFSMLTQPTATQHRAFELLEVSPSL